MPRHRCVCSPGCSAEQCSAAQRGVPCGCTGGQGCAPRSRSRPWSRSSTDSKLQTRHRAAAAGYQGSGVGGRGGRKYRNTRVPHVWPRGTSLGCCAILREGSPLLMSPAQKTLAPSCSMPRAMRTSNRLSLRGLVDSKPWWADRTRSACGSRRTTGTTGQAPTRTASTEGSGRMQGYGGPRGRHLQVHRRGGEGSCRTARRQTVTRTSGSGSEARASRRGSRAYPGTRNGGSTFRGFNPMYQTSTLRSSLHAVEGARTRQPLVCNGRLLRMRCR